MNFMKRQANHVNVVAPRHEHWWPAATTTHGGRSRVVREFLNLRFIRVSVALAPCSVFAPTTICWPTFDHDYSFNINAPFRGTRNAPQNRCTTKGTTYGMEWINYDAVDCNDGHWLTELQWTWMKHGTEEARALATRWQQLDVSAVSGTLKYLYTWIAVLY